MCSICGQWPCDERCPNKALKVVDYCVVCNEPIYEGDEYYLMMDEDPVCCDCVAYYIRKFRRTA